MGSPAEPQMPIYSTLGDDPDLGELVELFVEEMPSRIEMLQQEYDVANWQGLRQLAHQLKGAAGSYGFHQITPVAGNLESVLTDEENESLVASTLADLLDLCRRARAGSPA